MPQYFLAKVDIGDKQTFGAEIETKSYLVNAVSLSDTDIRVIGALCDQGIPYENIYVYSAKEEIIEQVFNAEQFAVFRWYKVTAIFEIQNDDNGQIKTSKKTYYIAADFSAPQTAIFNALYDIGEQLRGIMDTWRITKIEETTLADVIEYDASRKFEHLPEPLKKQAFRYQQADVFEKVPT